MFAVYGIDDYLFFSWRKRFSNHFCRTSVRIFERTVDFISTSVFFFFLDSNFFFHSALFFFFVLYFHFFPLIQCSSTYTRFQFFAHFAPIFDLRFQKKGATACTKIKKGKNGKNSSSI